jgi:predicted acylesterase/phospholipase RssA
MEESQENNKKTPEIKHISISGGGLWGFNGFGILYKAIQDKFIDINAIESIYATSIGSIISTMIMLKIDIDILRNYIIKRPWGNVWKITLDDIISSYQKKGICDKKIILECFTSLLKSVDLSIDITMKQFYEYSGIEFHIYTTEINRFELTDISFKTHPDWLLLDAIYASCSIPGVFSPIITDEHCFIDGGIFLNDPSSKCIEDVLQKGGSIDQIFSVAKKYTETKYSTSKDIQDTNILEFNRMLINKLLYVIQETQISEQKMTPIYEIKTFCSAYLVDDVISIMNSSEIRKKMIDEGIDVAKEYFDTITIK